VCVCMYVCVYVCMCVCVCMCMYVCVCMCTFLVPPQYEDAIQGTELPHASCLHLVRVQQVVPSVHDGAGVGGEAALIMLGMRGPGYGFVVDEVSVQIAADGWLQEAVQAAQNHERVKRGVVAAVQSAGEAEDQGGESEGGHFLLHSCVSCTPLSLVILREITHCVIERLANADPAE
jgi:hypothetical protein